MVVLVQVSVSIVTGLRRGWQVRGRKAGSEERRAGSGERRGAEAQRKRRAEPTRACRRLEIGSAEARSNIKICRLTLKFIKRQEGQLNYLPIGSLNEFNA